ncbi:unnamed protein product [Merluccius merluccius]
MLIPLLWPSLSPWLPPLSVCSVSSAGVSPPRFALNRAEEDDVAATPAFDTDRRPKLERSENENKKPAK